MTQDPVILVELAVLLTLVGAFAGVLAGLLGVGGGIILVPAFYFVFVQLGFESGQLMQLCLATSLATIIVTSVRSVMAHNRRGVVDWAVLRGWAPGIILGAGLGVLVVSRLDTVTLQFIFAGLAVAVGLYMALGRVEWRLGTQIPTGLKRACIAPLIGLLSVLIGVGGGSLGVPLMTLHGRPIHQAVGTAAGFGMLIAVPAVIGFLLVPMPPDIRPPFTIGVVNLPAFALVVSMTLITAPFGARLAHRLDARLLKRVFAVFLLMVAANMIRKALGA